MSSSEDNAFDITPGILHNYIGFGNDGGFYIFKKNEGWYYLSLGIKVVKVFSDIFTNEQILVLKFVNLTGEVVKIDFPRKDLNKQGILSLTKYGYSVNPENANAIIHCVEELEFAIGKAEKCYSRLGWHVINNRLCFLGINESIGIKASYRGAWSNNKKQGSEQVWTDMLEEEVFGNTSLEIALGVGYASTLIGFLRKLEPSIESFMVHTSGNSSTGKSSAAMVALSPGGSSTIAGNDKSLMLDYSGTEASIISMLQHLNGYPVAIDEASMGKNLTTLIYQLSNGRERTRLNPDASLKDTGVWESVIFSTGEQNLLSKSDSNLGLYVRCINLSFDYWTESAEQSRKIKSVVSKNYGHGTEKFAKYLYELYENDNSDVILNKYHQFKEDLASTLKQRIGDNHIVDRLAGKLAVITTAFFFGVLSLGYEVEGNTIEDMHRLLVEQIPLDTIEGMDLSKKAYEILMNDIVTNHMKYPKNTEQQINSSIFGVIVASAGTTKTGLKYVKRVSVLKEHLEELLSQHRFRDINIILKAWREQGLLFCKTDRFISAKKISINGVNATAYEVAILPEKNKYVRELVKRPKPQITKKFMDYVEGKLSVEEVAGWDDDFWEEQYQLYLQEKEDSYFDNIYSSPKERTDGLDVPCGKLNIPRKVNVVKRAVEERPKTFKKVVYWGEDKK